MGHPMPPRTTQKSCKAWPLRQKSQIEPWLAHRPQILLVSVSVWHRQFDADTMYPIIPSATLLLLKAKDHRRRKGLNDENLLSPASREKCFLLTLPFIEPAEVGGEVRRCGVNVSVSIFIATGKVFPTPTKCSPPPECNSDWGLVSRGKLEHNVSLRRLNVAGRHFLKSPTKR
jgi:hypothetical protein